VQPLLAPRSGFDSWHSALTAGICLSVKLLADDGILASDMTYISSYSSQYLVDLEARAFAVWLPKIVRIHNLALAFHTSLLGLALSRSGDSDACAPSLREFTILIVEEDAALRAEHVAVAQAVAPNATILCAGCYVAARDQTFAREEAGSPVHLVLAGACVDEACAMTTVRSVKDFVDDINPRTGVIHTDMRDRPLTVAILDAAAQEAVHQALWGVVDAVVLGGRVTAAALLTLLDFVSERHLGALTPTEPQVAEPAAVAAAQAASGQPCPPLLPQSACTTPATPATPVPQAAPASGGGFGMGGMGGGGFGTAPVAAAPLPPQIVWQSSVWAASLSQLAPTASATLAPLFTVTATHAPRPPPMPWQLAVRLADFPTSGVFLESGSNLTGAIQRRTAPHPPPRRSC